MGAVCWRAWVRILVVLDSETNLSDLPVPAHSWVGLNLPPTPNPPLWNMAMSLLIKAYDIDVLVIASTTLWLSKIQVLKFPRVEFDKGQFIRCFMPMIQMVENFSPEKSHCVLFFHAFTGCDEVSSFLALEPMGRSWYILTATSHEYFTTTSFWSRTPNSSW